MKLKLDLANAGKHTTAFEQTCAVAHAQCLVLIPEHAGDLPRLQAAASSVSVSIHKDGASESLAVDLSVVESSTVQEVALARLHPVPDGLYTCSANIAASETAALPATLVMRNELCGLERLPGTISSAIGWILACAGVVSLVLGGFAVSGLARKAT